MLLAFNLQTVFGIGAFILLALLVLGFVAMRQVRVGSGALVAEGHIVDFDEQLVGATVDPGMITKLMVRFTTATGETVTAPTPTGNSLARLQYKRGQRVRVHYDPGNPHRLTVSGFDDTNQTLIWVVFGLLTLGFLVLGGFLYFLTSVLPK